MPDFCSLKEAFKGLNVKVRRSEKTYKTDTATNVRWVATPKKVRSQEVFVMAASCSRLWDQNRSLEGMQLARTDSKNRWGIVRESTWEEEGSVQF